MSNAAFVEVVHGSITDLAGNPLAAPTTWRWLQPATAAIVLEVPPPARPGHLRGVVPIQVVASGHPPAALWLDFGCSSGPPARLPLGVDGRIDLDTTRVTDGDCWMTGVAQVGRLVQYTEQQSFRVDNTPPTVRIEPRASIAAHPDHLMARSAIDVIFSEQMDAARFGTVEVVVTDGAGRRSPMIPRSSTRPRRWR